MIGETMQLQEAKRCGVTYWHVEEWTAAGISHGFVGADIDLRSGPGKWKEAFGSPGRRLCLLDQVHGCSICEISRENVDNLADFAGERGVGLIAGDAWLVSSAVAGFERYSFGIKTADCFPVLIRTRSNALVAAVHCGWRGTAQGLLGKVLQRIIELGIPPEDIEAAIGPGAQKCCYVVQQDVASVLAESAKKTSASGAESEVVGETARGQISCSLSTLLKLQALQAGLRSSQIAALAHCTICDERFFSFRRQKSESGRQVSFISVPR